MPETTLVACAHGTRHPAGRRATGDLIAAVRTLLADTPVRCAYIDVQDPAPAQVLDAVDGPAVLVPVLLSVGYHVRTDLGCLAEVRDGVRLGRPMGPDRRLLAPLAARLPRPGGDDAVVLVATGSRDPQTARNVREAADLLSQLIAHPVSVGYLSAEPSARDVVRAAREAGARRVMIAEYLLAPGVFADRVDDCGGDLRTGPILDGDPRVTGSLALLLADRFHEQLRSHEQPQGWPSPG